MEAGYHRAESGIGEHAGIVIVLLERGILCVNLGLRLQDGRARLETGNQMLVIPA
jgi:hypothetical protein